MTALKNGPVCSNFRLHKIGRSKHVFVAQKVPTMLCTGDIHCLSATATSVLPAIKIAFQAVRIDQEEWTIPKQFSEAAIRLIATTGNVACKFKTKHEVQIMQRKLMPGIGERSNSLPRLAMKEDCACGPYTR